MTARLSDALNFQGQALLLRAERQRVLASNIANADTPGYVARDFDFANALRDAAGQLAPPPGTVLPPSLGPSFQTLRPPLATPRYTTTAQDNLDRNTVDMDRERAAFAENTLKVDAALRFLNGSVRTLQDAMKSHNQA